MDKRQRIFKQLDRLPYRVKNSNILPFFVEKNDKKSVFVKMEYGFSFLLRIIEKFSNFKGIPEAESF